MKYSVFNNGDREMKCSDGSWVTVKRACPSKSQYMQWVAAHDRMPEKLDFKGQTKEYLVSILVANKYISVSLALYTFEGKWLLGTVNPVHRVTHWMPLPEPPFKGV